MTILKFAQHDVCAVFVTYFPEPSCALNLCALVKQLSKVVVVDNGSSSESFAPIEAVAERNNVWVMRLGRNLGIAAALNAGLRFAKDHGFQWLATFDQDSRVTSNMVEEMFRAFWSCPHRDRVAIVAPRVVDQRSGVELTLPGEKETAASWRALHLSLTSGNLVRVDAAFEVGGFDDSLFIDYVDHEFCLRVRRSGFRILEARHAKLMHALGRLEYRRFIFLPVAVTHHAPVRHYYRARNRLIVWKLYWRYDPICIVRDILWVLPLALWIVLYEQNSSAKLRMMLRGIYDGIRNVRGEYFPLRRQVES